MRPSQRFWGTARGTRAFISGEQGNKGLKKRETGTKVVLGNREHRRSDFHFGEWEQSDLFQGNNGNRTPAGRAS